MVLTSRGMSSGRGYVADLALKARERLHHIQTQKYIQKMPITSSVLAL